MILDALLQFDPPATSVAIAAGDQPSTNVLDFGIDGIPTEANGGGARDMGIGYPLRILCQVDTAFTSAGSTGTIQVAVQYAPDDGTGAPGSFITAALGPLYVVPGVGAQLCNMDLPRPKDGLVPRFCRLLYTVATQTMATGTVNAYIVLDREDQPNQASGYLGAYRSGLTVSN